MGKVQDCAEASWAACEGLSSWLVCSYRCPRSGHTNVKGKGYFTLMFSMCSLVRIQRGSWFAQFKRSSAGVQQVEFQPNTTIIPSRCNPFQAAVGESVLFFCLCLDPCPQIRALVHVPG
jgi:hypothetical protein